MPTVRFVLEGLEDALGALDGMAQGIADAMSAGVMEAAQLIQGDAIENAPVDTGELRAGIVVRGPEKSGLTVSAEIAATAPHSEFVELGSGEVGASAPKAEHGITKTYRTGGWVYPVKGGGFRFTRGQRPQPFLYPAYKAQLNTAIQIIGEAAKKGAGA